MRRSLWFACVAVFVCVALGCVAGSSTPGSVPWDFCVEGLTAIME